MTKHLLSIALIVLALSYVTCYQKLESRNLSRRSDNSSIKMKEDISENEIEDTRIKVSEPYKSLIQTTARFALAQSRLANLVNIDTAMTMINDTFYMLSKPSTLIRVFKVISVFFATFFTSALFFPTTQKIIDRIWRDPSDALNLDRFLTNGVGEKSVLDMISSRTDEALNRVGLTNNRCRERSLCYLGEVLRCAFPMTSDALSKFSNENFSSSFYKDNRYFKAFSFGFNDQNCTRVQTDLIESGNCIGRFFNNILGNNRQQTEESSS